MLNTNVASVPEAAMSDKVIEIREMALRCRNLAQNIDGKLFPTRPTETQAKASEPVCMEDVLKMTACLLVEAIGVLDTVNNRL